jgi:hypothetical protein
MLTPVRTYTSATEMLAAYAELQARTWRQPMTPQRPVVVIPEPPRAEQTARTDDMTDRILREAIEHHSAEMARVRQVMAGSRHRREIIAECAAAEGVAPDDLRSDRKFARIVRARQQAIARIYDLYGDNADNRAERDALWTCWLTGNPDEPPPPPRNLLSLPGIAALFGIDHTSVLHALRVTGRAPLPPSRSMPKRVAKDLTAEAAARRTRKNERRRLRRAERRAAREAELAALGRAA